MPDELTTSAINEWISAVAMRVRHAEAIIGMARDGDCDTDEAFEFGPLLIFPEFLYVKRYLHIPWFKDNRW